MLLAAAMAGWLVVQGVAFAQDAAGPSLVDAVKLGQLARVRSIVAEGHPVDQADWRGMTPLVWAAASGHADIVRALLEAGARVNHRTADGTTALHLAAANGFADIVELLVGAGADVSARREGSTARQFAAGRGHPAVAAILEGHEARGVRLRQAVVEGHDAAVRQLVAQGAPVNASDDAGATPVMVAARNGDLGILQLLVSRGAELDRRDNEGSTVLDWAARAPLTAPYVAAFLRDRAADGGPVARLAAVRPDPPPVVQSLRALHTVLARVPPATEPLRRAQRSAQAALAELLALSARWPAESPEDYRLGLAAEATLVEDALRRGEIPAMTTVLEALAEDLEAKLEHCRMSGGRLGGSVAVRVRTVSGGAEVASWQVFYMPKVFEASPGASPDLFPQLSSPTLETLVPGRYVMWVRDPATARVGERAVVKVGEGRSELLVDLPVPTRPSP